MTQQPTKYTLAFGLTADPPHRGHEQVIRNSFAWAQAQGLTIARFVLIPTYQPNLIAGKKQPRTPYKHRRTMCQIMANEVSQDLNKTVEVSDIEKEIFTRTKAKSYSFDTLSALHNQHPTTKVLFVVSADHFAGRWPKFRQWHRWQDLAKTHGLMIHQRPGHRINTRFVAQLQAGKPSHFRGQ